MWFKNIKINKKKINICQKAKTIYEWCFWKLKCYRIGAADPIKNSTAKNSKSSVFRSKQITTKVPLKIFRDLEVRKYVRLMFWRRKNSMQGRCYVSSVCQQRNKVRLVYLECGLGQDRSTWDISKLKCQKAVDRSYLETRKRQRSYRWWF